MSYYSTGGRVVGVRLADGRGAVGGRRCDYDRDFLAGLIYLGEQNLPADGSVRRRRSAVGLVRACRLYARRLKT